MVCGRCCGPYAPEGFTRRTRRAFSLRLKKYLLQPRNPGPDGVFPHSMIKRFSILSALLVLATMGLASAAQAKPAIGIADQTVDTLKDPRFQKSGLKRYRIAVSYDEIRKGGRLLSARTSSSALAEEQDLDVIVSFYRTSSLKNRSAPRACCLGGAASARISAPSASATRRSRSSPPGTR